VPKKSRKRSAPAIKRLLAGCGDRAVKFTGNDLARAAICNEATAMINKRMNPSMTAENTEIFGFCLRGSD
jgi:hypothetical protein